LARAFAAAGRRQGWRVLLLPRSETDLSKAVEAALGILGFPPHSPLPAAKPAESRRPESNLLDAFGDDLTRRVREGTAEPTVGRLREIERILASVLGWQPRLAIVAGECGAGKTNLLHGVARRLSERLPPARLVSTDLAVLMAGACLESERENLLATALNEAAAAGAVLAMEHLEFAVMSLPRGPWLLAHAIDRGARLIGTTQPAHLAKFECDLLARRLDVFDLPELDPAATLEVLKTLSGRIAQHHGVTIEVPLLGAVVERSLSLAGCLPAKAVALIDRAASQAVLAGSGAVELLHVYLAGSESREAGQP